MVKLSNIWRVTAVVLLVTTSAQAQTRAQQSVITQLLWQSLLQCYDAPDEFIAADDRIVLHAELNTNGDIVDLPEILSPDQISKGERALLRQATTALIMCTPFISDAGDRAIFGVFDIVADQSGLSLTNVETNVGAPEVVEIVVVEVPTAPLAVEPSASTPAPEPPTPASGAANQQDETALGLNRTARREIQRRLSLLGYDTRGIDGVFGPGSRRAITKWQTDNSIPPTGYFNGQQVEYLNKLSQVKYDIWDARPKRYTDRNGCLREANGKIIEGRSFGCDLSAASQSLGLSR